MRSTHKSDLFDFLNLHRHAVQASHSADGSPQAALVGFVANERLELFFDSFDSARKVANLRRDPLPGTIYFRVRPVWIRYIDLNTNPPQIVTFS